ncbi:hypothetical protein GcM3_05026 [Golovinomyces cichoracearum]|uniref:Uncharacterized protein n=1 Tax=Golovinomyces cichoracearum TaxID=62708 RepID=A0A420JA27_9PEZI|nr:hypothetical protein GcM3_05026 [Golovinomyces cichoracearum]
MHYGAIILIHLSVELLKTTIGSVKCAFDGVDNMMAMRPFKYSILPLGKYPWGSLNKAVHSIMRNNYNN